MTTPPPPPHATPLAVTAEQRARAHKLIDAQLATLSMEGYTGNEPLLATFAPTAIVIAPHATTLEGLGATLGRYLVDADGSNVQVGAITAEHVELAAIGVAISIDFELGIDKTRDGIAVHDTTPITELLVGDSVVAMIAGRFQVPRAVEARDVPTATAPADLAALLASPAAAAKAARADLVVTTPEKRAVGAAALAALATLPVMTIHAAREIQDGNWGFVQAHLDGPDHTRLVGQLIAFRDTPNSAWAIVSLHVDGS
ncbi:MAG TPA: hypothetical protein VH165_09305 [Kofleriaceae bacterium]|nr:hypothetical protein [Kofleriaceae bacterium]